MLIKKVLDLMKNDISYKFNADLIGKGLDEKLITKLKDIESKAKMLSIIFELGFQGNPRKCKRFLNILAMRASIAGMRNLDINEAVLCKLMMLEYYKPEIFNVLLNDQIKNNGYARALCFKDIPVEDPYSKFRDDEWFQTWLKNEPVLNNIELGKYIYISRTNYKLGFASVAMSQFAKTIYEKLLAGGFMNQTSAFEKFDQLSDAEAGAIFDELIKDINIKPDSQSTYIKYLIQIALKKKIFKNRVIDYLNNLKKGHISIKLEVDNFKAHYNIDTELEPFYKKLSEDKNFINFTQKLKTRGN